MARPSLGGSSQPLVSNSSFISCNLCIHGLPPLSRELSRLTNHIIDQWDDTVAGRETVAEAALEMDLRLHRCRWHGLAAGAPHQPAVA